MGIDGVNTKTPAIQPPARGDRLDVNRTRRQRSASEKSGHPRRRRGSREPEQEDDPSPDHPGRIDEHV